MLVSKNFFFFFFTQRTNSAGAFRLFLQQFPEYDGRGVRIAIVDSGIDTSVEGLQVTSEGKPKIIDSIDCSGAGDIDISKVVAPNLIHQDGDNVLLIPGHSGRTLRIAKNLANPTGVWRVGSVLYLDLLPWKASARKRIQGDLKKKAQDEAATLRSNLRKQLEQAPKDSEQASDLTKQLECLGLLENGQFLSDDVALVDIVSWHDGKDFRALVSLDTDMTALKPMTSFAKERQVTFLNTVDCVSFSVNFYDHGNTINIFTSETHGTHCAGIAAGYYPNNPDMNGVAPGAEVLNLKISDFRAGTNETHVSLERAVKLCVEYKVDILSLSFGEADFKVDGRFSQHLTEMIREHGILFVTSAGNDGPCYHTGAHPGPSAAPYFNVAAALTPEISGAAYGMHKPSRVKPFSFSSRGPCIQNGLNANILAPGAANSGTPAYNLSKLVLANGTSMACPNVSGCMALILSGLKQRKIPYNPWTLVALAEASASAEGLDGFQWPDYGCGLIQTLKCFDLACAQKPSPCYVIAETEKADRGVCIRDGRLDQCKEESFMLSLYWPSSTPATVKSNFLWSLKLTSDKPWISHPQELICNAMGRNVSVKVDPRGLPAGSHFGQVVCTTPDNLQVLRIPVSIFVPERIDGNIWRTQAPVALSQSSPPYRRLIQTPSWATHFVVKLTLEKLVGGGRNRLCLDVNMRVPGKRDSKATMSHVFAVVNEGQELVRADRCPSEASLEVVLSTGEADGSTYEVSCSVTFFSFALQGVWANSATGEPVVYSDQGAALVALKNFSPAAQRTAFSSSIKSLSRAIRPSSASAVRLLPEERYVSVGTKIPLSEIELTYEFSFTESFDLLLSTLLDECTYGYAYQTFVSLFTKNKEYLSSWAWGGRNIVSDTYSVKSVPKGSYLAKVYVRHESAQKLEKFKNLPLTLEVTLGKSISLPIYSSLLGSVTGEGTVNIAVMNTHEVAELWVGAPSSEYPCYVQKGDVLRGTLNLAGAAPAVLSYPLAFVVQSVPNGGPKNGSSGASSDATPGKSLDDRLRDVEIQSSINFFSSLKEPFSQWERLAEERLKSLPSHHPLLLELRLVCLRAACSDDSVPRAHIVRMCDDILQGLSPNDIAMHFGMQCSDARLRKEYSARRDALIETLTRKAECLSQQSTSQPSDAAREALTALRQWVEPGDSRVVQIQSQMWRRGGLAGHALLALWQEAKARPEGVERQTYAGVIELLQRLKWTYYETLALATMRQRFPGTFFGWNFKRD